MAFNPRMNKKNDRVHYSNKSDRQHSFGRGHQADSSDRSEDHRKDDRKFGKFSKFDGADRPRFGDRREERSDRSESTGARYGGYSKQPERPSYVDADRARPRSFENKKFTGAGFRERPEVFEVVCANCGKHTTVPFKPTGNKPVLCRDCFKAEGGAQSYDRAPRRDDAPRKFADTPRFAKKLDRSGSAERKAAPRFARRESSPRSEGRSESYAPSRSSGAFSETRIKGVFEFKNNIYTRNAVPGQIVYGEKLFTWDGVEYRPWDPMRSKLGAGIKKGVTQTGIVPGATVLYLGCSTGTTVSHVSELVTAEGIVYALDVAPRVMRDLVMLAKTRHNIFPLIADANRPTTFAHAVPQVDAIFMDIAQSNQVEIFLKNVHAFLKPGGLALLSLKSRSIDITKTPQEIYTDTRKLLEKEMKIIDYKTLDPFEKDHALFVCKKE